MYRKSCIRFKGLLYMILVLTLICTGFIPVIAQEEPQQQTDKDEWAQHDGPQHNIYTFSTLIQLV